MSEFKSIAVLSGKTEDQPDEVWTVVRRYIDGSWRNYIERFDSRIFSDNLYDAYFVDCRGHGYPWYQPYIAEIPEVPDVQFRDEALVIANGNYVQFFDANYTVTLQKQDSGGAPIMSVDVDADGNVVYGRVSGSAPIGRWDSEMNYSTNFYTPTGGSWPWVAVDVASAVRFSTDSQYLYLIADEPAGTPKTWVMKFDNTTGAEVWRNNHSWPTYSADIDAAGNVYVPLQGGGIQRYDADGNKTGTFSPTLRTDALRDCFYDAATERVYCAGSAIEAIDITQDPLLGTAWRLWETSYGLAHAILTLNSRLYLFTARTNVVLGPWADADGDPSCVALWRFEPGALTADSRGNNILTAGGTPDSDAVNYKDGSGSVDFESDSSERYYFTPNDPSYPLSGYDTNKQISVACWFRAESMPGEGQGHAIYAHRDNGQELFYLGLTTTGGSTYVQMSIGTPSSTWETANLFDTPCVTGIWYHVLVTFKNSTKAWTMRVWDDNAGALLGPAESGTTTNNIATGSQTVNIGYLDASGTSYFDGNIDCMAVFNDIVTADEHDQMIAGTYTYGTSNAGYADVLELDPDDGSILNSYDTGTSTAGYMWVDKDENIIVKHPTNQKFYVLDAALSLQATYSWSNIGVDSYGAEGAAIPYITAGTPGTPGQDEAWGDTSTGWCHLEGETVNILADGVKYPQQTVTDCQVDDTEFADASVVTVGLPVKFYLQPMRAGVTALTFIPHRNITHVILNLLRSLDAEYGRETDELDVIPHTYTNYNAGPTLFTGTTTLAFPGEYDQSGDIWIYSNGPLPFTLRAIGVKFGTDDDRG